MFLREQTDPGWRGELQRDKIKGEQFVKGLAGPFPRAKVPLAGELSGALRCLPFHSPSCRILLPRLRSRASQPLCFLPGWLVEGYRVPLLRETVLDACWVSSRGNGVKSH